MVQYVTFGPTQINYNSERARDFIIFSQLVLDHIDKYTVPQYGDKGYDPATTASTHDFMMAIKKYTARFGRNQRPGQDKLDLLKIAHYAQLAFDSIIAAEKYDQPDSSPVHSDDSNPDQPV